MSSFQFCHLKAAHFLLLCSVSPKIEEAMTAYRNALLVSKIKARPQLYMWIGRDYRNYYSCYCVYSFYRLSLIEENRS